MSNVKLKTPSNGSVSLTPQDTASDVVLTVPAGTSTVVTNATLPTQLNASGDAPIYACRAWINFDSAGTIRASGNVSSLTRNGVGDHTINFSSAMPDALYALVSGSTVANTGRGGAINGENATSILKSTTQVRVLNMSLSSSASDAVISDASFNSFAIFR